MLIRTKDFYDLLIDSNLKKRVLNCIRNESILFFERKKKKKNLIAAENLKKDLWKKTF